MRITSRILLKQGYKFSTTFGYCIVFKKNKELFFFTSKKSPLPISWNSKNKIVVGLDMPLFEKYSLTNF